MKSSVLLLWPLLLLSLNELFLNQNMSETLDQHTPLLHRVPSDIPKWLLCGFLLFLILAKLYSIELITGKNYTLCLCEKCLELLILIYVLDDHQSAVWRFMWEVSWGSHFVLCTGGSSKCCVLCTDGCHSTPSLYNSFLVLNSNVI